MSSDEFSSDMYQCMRAVDSCSTRLLTWMVGCPRCATTQQHWHNEFCQVGLRFDGFQTKESCNGLCSFWQLSV